MWCAITMVQWYVAPLIRQKYMVQIDGGEIIFCTIRLMINWY